MTEVTNLEDEYCAVETSQTTEGFVQQFNIRNCVNSYRGYTYCVYSPFIGSIISISEFGFGLATGCMFWR